jgi:hypothetical protein
MNTKLLALKRLGIEPNLNSIEQHPKKALNFGGVKTGQTFNGSTPDIPPKTRYAYRFTLKDGQGGGMYITPVSDLSTARRDLQKRYGDRLLLVSQFTKEK